MCESFIESIHLKRFSLVLYVELALGSPICSRESIQPKRASLLCSIGKI